MLNPLNFISKFIKSSNQKELDRVAKIVEKVNSFEDKIKDIPDEDFPKKTIELKKRLSDGALAITNRGGATSREILELARLIQERVSARWGINLIPEPNLIGF